MTRMRQFVGSGMHGINSTEWTDQSMYQISDLKLKIFFYCQILREMVIGYAKGIGVSVDACQVAFIIPEISLISVPIGLFFEKPECCCHRQ